MQKKLSSTLSVYCTGCSYRWGYGYFAIALALYHFISTFVWIYVLFHFGDTGGWGFLIFLCGVTPSLSIFIWLIVDSTVACCNPPVGDISNICGCDCLPAAKKVMVYPVAVCSGLRVILWIVLIGAAAGHNLSYGEEEVYFVFDLLISFHSNISSLFFPITSNHMIQLPLCRTL